MIYKLPSKPLGGSIKSLRGHLGRQMGISARNGCRDLLVDCLRLSGKPLPELTILEFGNQRLKDDEMTDLHLSANKYVLEFYGADVVSIDLNGKDGAIAFDLSQPIKKRRWQNKFDIATNFGTIEHIEFGQLEAFANMHRLTKLEGIMVHWFPSNNMKLFHGYWQYSLEWAKQLSADNGYEILKIYEHDKSKTDNNCKPGIEISVQVIYQKKTNSEFNRKAFIDPMSQKGMKLGRRGRGRMRG